MKVTANTIQTTVVRDVTVTLSPSEARSLINFLVSSDFANSQYPLRVALADALNEPTLKQLREALDADPEAQKDAVSGRKILAIKAIREAVPGAGLKQSKDVVDEYARQQQEGWA